MDHILSASKLKTLKSCSWLFYCHYGPWRLPKKNNDGARRGTVVHALFECLLNPKNKHYYDKIIANRTIVGIPVIERFVKMKMKSEEISGVFDQKDNHNFDLIDQMIQVGLRHDFYCNKGVLEKAETDFEYKNEELDYHIRGFIDKIAQYGDKLHIKDYKTSAQMFEGEDLTSNVQAMMYSLYAKRVREMQSIVEFIFLRFPDAPPTELSFDDKSLEGFEQYLSYITKYLKNFSFREAQSNFAADQPMPKKGEGFKGPLLCGYGKFPGHTNKFGKEYWVCPFKFGFDYYILIDKVSNKIIDSSYQKEKLKETEILKIEKRVYKGCPRHINFLRE